MSGFTWIEREDGDVTPCPNCKDTDYQYVLIDGKVVACEGCQIAYALNEDRCRDCGTDELGWGNGRQCDRCERGEYEDYLYDRSRG